MKNGWQTKTLDQISTNLDSRRVPITKGVRAVGEYPYYGASGIVDYVAEYIFDENALLISEDGANLLARSTPIAFPVSGKYWVNNHAHILRFESLTTQRFVELYLESIPLDDYVTGAAQPKLTQKALNSIPIPFPPLPEQQRIVSILDEAFDGIARAKANAEKNLQNARVLFESTLTSAMRGELTSKWRKSHPRVETGSELLDRILAKRRSEWSKKGKYAEPVASATNDRTSIPLSWTLANLAQLKAFSLYGPRFSNDDYSISGVLVLRTSDIDERGKVNSDTAPKLKMTEEEFTKYRCNKGDLLFTRTGSLGTLAVFNDDTKAIPGAYLIQFRPIITEIIPWFLFAFFKSTAGQERLTSGAKGTGVPNLNVPTLEGIPIPFPPLEEQGEIVAQLDALAAETQRLESIYQQKLAALGELKKSLLHQAFSGQL